MSDELAKYFVNNIRQLRTICWRVNKIKDFLRRKSRKVSQINMTDIVSSLGKEVNASDFYSNLAVDETRPYDEIEKYESSLPVRKALTHLSKKHREIIVRSRLLSKIYLPTNI